MKHLSPPTTAPYDSDSVEMIREQVEKKAGVSIDLESVMDSFRESSFHENSALHAEIARLRAAMAEMQQGSEEKSDMRGSWDRVEKNVQNNMNTELAELERMREEAMAEPDAMLKAHKLLECELAFAHVSTKSRNLDSLGDQLDIVIGFVSEINGQLGEIRSELNSLHHSVDALAKELRRLTGRPVLEEYEEWRRTYLARLQGRLPSGKSSSRTLSLSRCLPRTNPLTHPLTLLPSLPQRYISNLHSAGQVLWRTSSRTRTKTSHACSPPCLRNSSASSVRQGSRRRRRTTRRGIGTYCC